MSAVQKSLFDTSARPLIELQNAYKIYGGTRALDGASLALWSGEVHALMGENGAGKSTLIKVLAGVATLDTGTIRMDGSVVTMHSPRAASALGLRFIHQELNIVRSLSVAENIFIGTRYPRWLGAFVDWRALHTQAERALTALGVTHIRPQTPMGYLSMGDHMLVKIAAALLDEARVYVMDEPTAALTTSESDRLFKAIRTLCGRGAAVLYVSHRLSEVFTLADRVTVLRDGKTVATVHIEATTPDHLIQAMTGRAITQVYPPRTVPISDQVLLDVRGLQTRAVHNLSFQVHAGEIVGLAGLSGAGRSETLRALIGAEAQTGGSVLLRGKLLHHMSPASAWARGLAYVPEERRAQGLLLTRSVRDNVTLPHLGNLSRAGILLRRVHEDRLTARIGQSVRLRSRNAEQHLHELSGGNQQKVVFGRALSGDPQVLLLDEPTRGVDVGAKRDIYDVIRAFAARGKAVVMVSSDLPELIGLCDRLLILHQGALRDDIPTQGLTEADLLARYYDISMSATPITSHDE